MDSALRIDVDRPDALADEQVVLTISGGHSGERVHLHSRLTVRNGDLWESTLVFVANEQGVVELASVSPVSGEYSEPVDWKAPDVELSPGYAACLTQEGMAAAIIPVENAHCPILMLNGADDLLWPSKDLTEVSAERLRDKDYPYYFEHISYLDAGHTATATPYAPCGVTSVEHPVVGLKIAFGGTPLGNLRASEDAWRRSLELLNSTIGRVP